MPWGDIEFKERRAHKRWRDARNQDQRPPKEEKEPERRDLTLTLTPTLTPTLTLTL